jgi:ABC-type transport system substrate-binding protein
MYATITQMMYDNYTNIWLVSPTDFAVTNVNLKGVFLNPMGSGLPYVMSFNTEYT